MKSKISSLPYAFWSVAFTIIPMAIIVFFAFSESNGSLTVANFRQSMMFAPVIFNSIRLSIVATLICLAIAYPLAYYISRRPAGRQKTFIMMILLPMWMNFLLRTYAWMTLLEHNGLINKMFGIFGLGPFEMINTQGAVILGMVYNYLPFMILPIYSVMTKIDNQIIEAARDLGCDTVGILKRVVFPLSMPGIVSGIVMVFVPAVSTFVISRLLGGGSFMLIGDLIEMQFLGNTYNPYLGSAISIALMIIILISMAITEIFDMEDKEELLL